MWHVSSRSGVATLRTAIHLLLTYLLTYLLLRASLRTGHIFVRVIVHNCRTQRKLHYLDLLWICCTTYRRYNNGCRQSEIYKKNYTGQVY